MSQWLQQAGNGTWLGGVNKTLPLPPKAKAVSGSGSAVTDYIGKTPGAFGYATSLKCISLCGTSGQSAIHYQNTWCELHSRSPCGEPWGLQQ